MWVKIDDVLINLGLARRIYLDWLCGDGKWTVMADFNDGLDLRLSKPMSKLDCEKRMRELYRDLKL